MKQAILLTLLCFASSLLGSAVTVAVLPDPPAPGEPAPLPELRLPEVITATTVLLVDEKGRTRIELAARMPEEGEEGHAITVYDDMGIEKLTAGLDGRRQPYFQITNSSLPNSDNRRVRLSVDESKASLEMGHSEVDEVLIQSAIPSRPLDSVIRLRARNGSSINTYVDEYGQATFEVKDQTTRSVLRVPEWQPLLPEE